MALISFIDGKQKIVTVEQGNRLWQLMRGEITPNPQEERFCARVLNVYLSWRTAPDSYIRERLDIIAPQVIGHWMCGRNGVPTRPEPSDVVNFAFSEKWGLLVYGNPTSLARKYF